jgi:hypothetical protein
VRDYDGRVDVEPQRRSCRLDYLFADSTEKLELFRLTLRGYTRSIENRATHLRQIVAEAFAWGTKSLTIICKMRRSCYVNRSEGMNGSKYAF